MNTKFFLPQNFFSRLFLSELNPSDSIEPVFTPSALISKKLLDNADSIGLIPTLDLLTFKDFFISSRIGISFNALLSNAYLFFKEDQDTLKEMIITGDVTSNEIILSKILFKEFYGIDIQPVLQSDQNIKPGQNFVEVGDRNFSDEIFLKGLSFSEEIIELVNAPYINFVLAGSNENAVKQFVNSYENNFLDGHETSLKKLNPDFPDLSKDFININIQHIIFDFENQDLEGIKSLLQMPYYHGMIKSMVDIKFV